MVTTAITTALGQQLVNSLGELITSEILEQRGFDKKIALALINGTFEGKNATHFIKLKFVSEFTMKALQKEYVAHTSKAELKSLMNDLTIMSDEELGHKHFSNTFM